MTRNYDPTVGIDPNGQPELTDAYVPMPERAGEPEPGTLSHPQGQRLVGRFEATEDVRGRRTAELVQGTFDAPAEQTGEPQYGDRPGGEGSTTGTTSPEQPADTADASGFNVHTASYRSLQQEAKRRGLPGDGTADELKARLA
jgi:hypothetical protein